MSVETKNVVGRRKLKFASIDEAVADAEKCVSSPQTKMLGNWPLGQLLMHLTLAMNSSIDGISAKAPWFIRLLSPLFKGRILKHGMSAGFKLPKEVEAGFFPAAPSSQEALEKFRAAANRIKTERMTSPHPVFGRLTHEEWMKLHLRHAELHLGFAVPQ
jgi:hypothetical protein